MILICEPSCKSFSHEKVNEGFIYKTLLAFPEQKIIFLGHDSHIQVLKKNLITSNINISRIQFTKCYINSNNTLLSLIFNFFLLKKIKKILRKNPIDKILFLSYSKIFIHFFKINNPVIQVFVMHGEFEEISNFSGSFNSFKNIPAPSFIKKIKNINFSIIKNFIINFLV